MDLLEFVRGVARQIGANTTNCLLALKFCKSSLDGRHMEGSNINNEHCQQDRSPNPRTSSGQATKTS